MRATVGVNSPLIQAVKFELTKPGVSLAKVCIMCGGPDWPTSVLCGILRQSDAKAGRVSAIKTAELCLCLAPMVILITPTVLAAAFQLRTGTPYAAVASVSLMVCSLVQLAAGVIATNFLNAAMSDPACKRQMAEGVDVEVEKRTEDDAQHAKVRAVATNFDKKLSCLEKAVLVTGTLLLLLSAYALLFASSYCFEDFNLATDVLAEVMCWGCERAFIKPPGLAALGMLVSGIVLNGVFGSMVKAKTRRYVASGGATQTSAKNDEERGVDNDADRMMLTAGTSTVASVTV